MRYPLLILLIGATASATAGPRRLPSFVQNSAHVSAKLRERDEIRRSFRLAPGARVEVSGIGGTVEVTTADTEVAEILIVRTAQSRADFDQYRFNIENGPQSLTIRGEQLRRDNGFGPDVTHQVTLRLPRRVDLAVASVSGQVQVGDVDGRVAVTSVGGGVTVGSVGGQLQVSNVSGAVTVGRAGQQAEVRSVGGSVRLGQVSGALAVSSVSGAVAVERAGARAEVKSVGGSVEIGEAFGSLDVSGVSGNLSVGLARLGEGGVQIKSVSGQLDLRLKGGLGAQLSADNVSGQVSLDVPGVTMQSRPNDRAVRARIGAGGAPIAINGVSKDVRLAPQGR